MWLNNGRMLTIRFPWLALAAFAWTTSARAHPLSIGDVTSIVTVEQATPSPDGRNVAIVLQRPAVEGEVAGRTYYEVDPSRNDIWLVSRDGSAKRNLTAGRSKAAGYWCPQWSPNGLYLAMLSTRPEVREPHGGDAVRLYLWSREQDTIQRASARPMMTMTRYGSPQNALDLRGGISSSDQPWTCSQSGEKAPYLWLDDHHLLVVQMPEGQNSALFTQYGRALEAAGQTAVRLRRGTESTVDISDSDRSKLAEVNSRYQAEIALINIVDGSRKLLASVPAFPFRGMLSVVVAPDRKTLAILAPVSVIPLDELGPHLFNNDEMQSVKRLGLISTDRGESLRWVALPNKVEYPLDLLEWSADSNELLFRARRSGSDSVATVFRLNSSSLKSTVVAPNLVSSPDDAGPWPHPFSARWAPDKTVLIRGHSESSAQLSESWWRVSRGGRLVAHRPPLSPAAPSLPATAQLLANDRYGVVWQEFTGKQTVVRARGLLGGAVRDLLTANDHLSTVDWGEVSILEYSSEDGQPLQSLIIQPPDYSPGRGYPTLVWLYPGNNINGLGGYWDDRLLPGIYNLQLYAAQGYVVLVPSMPLTSSVTDGPYKHLTNGVLPAVDRLIALGMADPNRLGAFGQSFGGYATYSLITQTHRFAAAAAIAGIADFTAMSGAFDRGGDGWPGAAQDKSTNSTIVRTVMGLAKPTFADPKSYIANSPVFHAAAIQTPLLIAQGSEDTRGNIVEAETIFSLLDQQGKSARLLRFHGENHAISLSPANIVTLHGELITWFDRHLKN